MSNWEGKLEVKTQGHWEIMHGDLH